MFGLKIFTKKAWAALQSNRQQLVAELQSAKNVCKKETDDNFELRKQLNEKMDEIRKLNKKLERESFASLHKYCIIKSIDYSCNKCKFEKKNCMKLHFSNQTICVCDKKDEKSFK